MGSIAPLTFDNQYIEKKHHFLNKMRSKIVYSIKIIQMDYISTLQLNEILEVETNTLILNVLSYEDYISHHIPNSVHVDVHDEAFCQKVKALQKDKNATIIVYGKDHTLEKSKIAHHKIENLGYKHCLILKGGLSEWEKNGLLLIER